MKKKYGQFRRVGRIVGSAVKNAYKRWNNRRNRRAARQDPERQDKPHDPWAID